jgi:hypothetical protein
MLLLGTIEFDVERKDFLLQRHHLLSVLDSAISDGKKAAATTTVRITMKNMSKT